MTDLRKLMLEELERRNYSPATLRAYLRAVGEFARYFNCRPDQLGPDLIRQYQAYLFRERKLSPGTIEGRKAADQWDPAKDEAAGEQCRAGIVAEPAALAHAAGDREQCQTGYRAPRGGQPRTNAPRSCRRRSSRP